MRKPPDKFQCLNWENALPYLSENFHGTYLRSYDFSTVCVFFFHIMNIFNFQQSKKIASRSKYLDRSSNFQVNFPGFVLKVNCV